jgi:hypothetical protein
LLCVASSIECRWSLVPHSLFLVQAAIDCPDDRAQIVVSQVLAALARDRRMRDVVAPHAEAVIGHVCASGNFESVLYFYTLLHELDVYPTEPRFIEALGCHIDRAVEQSAAGLFHFLSGFVRQNWRLAFESSVIGRMITVAADMGCEDRRTCALLVVVFLGLSDVDRDVRGEVVENGAMRLIADVVQVLDVETGLLLVNAMPAMLQVDDGAVGAAMLESDVLLALEAFAEERDSEEIWISVAALRQSLEPGRDHSA